MNVPIAFWDSSALIPLCVLQPQTAQARVLYKSHHLTVWWATPVEIMSGLTRLMRMGQIDAERLHAGKSTADQLAALWSMVEPSADIARRAVELLERFPLKAADALQLAAALARCAEAPRGSFFITADRRLADAAQLSGFTVEFLPA